MKYTLLLMLALALPSNAAPVHITLRANAGAGGDTVTLSQIADLTGGDKTLRVRLAGVPVGRAPLSGDTRTLSAGDIRLKLRQAGFHPETDAVLEGAPQVTVSGSAPLAAPASVKTSAPSNAPDAPLIHRGDSVSIVVQEGGMTITTKGVAREPGILGQTIRVHRDGVMTDLAATVIDALTVQMEI